MNKVAVKGTSRQDIFLLPLEIVDVCISVYPIKTIFIIDILLTQRKNQEENFKNEIAKNKGP